MAVYFTTAIRRYVDRAHAELRQKEKLLGIGQLVAGIAHQIANPLDRARTACGGSATPLETTRRQPNTCR